MLLIHCLCVSQETLMLEMAPHSFLNLLFEIVMPYLVWWSIGGDLYI